MKNIAKAMDRKSGGLAFFQKFPRISIENIKTCKFDGSQMRELVKEPMFDEAQAEAELSTWQSLKSVVTNFLWNLQNVEKDIEELLNSFCQHRAQMSLKLHFLQLHKDYFLNYCEDFREDQGECFY